VTLGAAELLKHVDGQTQLLGHLNMLRTTLQPQAASNDVENVHRSAMPSFCSRVVLTPAYVLILVRYLP